MYLTHLFLIRFSDMKNSNCLDTSIAIMTCSGIWLPKSLDNSAKKKYYIALGVIFQGILFISVILAEIAHLVQVLGDTEKTVDATVLLLSHVVQAVKILTICFKQKRIKALLHAIDGPVFNPDDPLARGILERTVRTLSLVGQLMAASAGITGIFWCVVPQLKSVLTLPLNTYYPFNVDEMPVFGIMYAYLSISVVVVGVGDAAENYLVAAILVLASAQLDVLTHRLHLLGNAANASTYDETVLCVKYHQAIIKYVEDIEEIFSSAIFCQFFTCCLVVCMAVFKISIVTEPLELVTMLFYLACVFMELLMYCYPGHLLISKSLLVADAWYSGWIHGDLKTRRVIFLMVLRAQRAICLRAGSLLHVSLPTAAAIVRTSYSYYAFLRQKHSQ